MKLKISSLYIGSVVLSIGAYSAYAADETVAYKLAVIDANQFVPKNGIEEKRAQTAIKLARSVCNTSSDISMSDQAVKLSNILNEHKIFTRPIDILEGLSAILEGTKSKNDCSKTMAQYASVRNSVGYTHSQAVAAMRVLVNASR